MFPHHHGHRRVCVVALSLGGLLRPGSCSGSSSGSSSDYVGHGGHAAFVDHSAAPARVAWHDPSPHQSSHPFQLHFSLMRRDAEESGMPQPPQRQPPHRAEQHAELRKRQHHTALFEAPGHHPQGAPAVLGQLRDDLVFVGATTATTTTAAGGSAGNASADVNSTNSTTTLPYSGPPGPEGPIGPPGDESVTITMGLTKIRLLIFFGVGVVGVLIYAKAVHSLIHLRKRGKAPSETTEAAEDTFVDRGYGYGHSQGAYGQGGWMEQSGEVATTSEAAAAAGEGQSARASGRRSSADAAASAEASAEAGTEADAEESGKKKKKKEEGGWFFGMF